MTSPTPVPAGGPLGSLEGQLNAELNSTNNSSTSSTDLYGLGDWGAQTINPGDLPILPGILSSGKQTTGNSIIGAFASGDPGSIAQIQRALYLGGYYSSSYTPTYGVIKPQDITAFGNAVTVAGQSKASVSQVLLNGAQYGTAAGVAAAQSQGTTAKVAAVKLPNTQDLEAEAMKAFQAELGRKATPEQAAAFAASYRAMSAGIQRTANQAQYDATTDSGGLTPQQGNKLQQQVAAAGEPTPGTPIPPDDGRLTTKEPINEQLQSEQSTAATAPTFAGELSNLGTVAQETQADATPDMQQGGLTQVEEETPESADVAAENYAQNTAPREAEATSVANTFDSFLNILGSNFGGGSA